MDLRQIDYFLAACGTLNFTRAAEAGGTGERQAAARVVLMMPVRVAGMMLQAGGPAAAP